MFSAPSPSPFSMDSSCLGSLSLKVPRNFPMPWSLLSGRKVWCFKRARGERSLNPKGEAFLWWAFGDMHGLLT